MRFDWRLCEFNRTKPFDEITYWVSLHRLHAAFKVGLFKNKLSVQMYNIKWSACQKKSYTEASEMRYLSCLFFERQNSHENHVNLARSMLLTGFRRQNILVTKFRWIWTTVQPLKTVSEWGCQNLTNRLQSIPILKILI